MTVVRVWLRRGCGHARRDERGSGSVYVLVAAALVLAMALAAAAVGDAVVQRHRAESLADLAAIAGAAAQQRGADGCARAGAYARSEGGWVGSCWVAGDGAVTVRVTRPAGRLLARLGLPVARAQARAGPSSTR